MFSSGQPGYGFEEPWSVRLKLFKASKGCRRPDNCQVSGGSATQTKMADPQVKSADPGKATNTLAKSAARVNIKMDWPSHWHTCMTHFKSSPNLLWLSQKLRKVSHNRPSLFFSELDSANSILAKNFALNNPIHWEFSNSVAF